MPRRTRGSAKAQAAASPKAGSLADSLNPTAPDTDTSGVNSARYTQIQDAMNVIEAITELKGIISGCQPARLDEGAAIAPFSAAQPKAKIGGDPSEVYTCGHNMFLTNPLRDASPGTPKANQPASPPSQPTTPPTNHCHPSHQACPSTPKKC